jgi:serine/threonine-protein kinase
MPASPPDSKRSGATLPLADGHSGVTLEQKTRARDSEHASTLLIAGTDSAPGAVDPSPVSFEPGTRYSVRRALGAGGMGEVRLCHDGWVGRDVAMKVMRSGVGSQSGARARFLREARVQGQLEHPSVVPVYDLGRGSENEDFFTMKRVNGHTLEEIVTGLAARDPEMCASYNQRKLVSAMSQICLAVAYAHSRGVVHRDLKPANLMLGDFGEVYVLDWGVSKIQGAAEIELDHSTSGETVVPATQDGVLVGTPGYMSPEQARSEPDLGPASDVYALGAILFELLSLDRLHHGKTVAALVASTLTAKPSPPSARSPDVEIAPELDAICMRALALDPIERFPSARAMHEALEAHLDGARDRDRRTALARAHLEKARVALEGAAQGGAERNSMRAVGLRELSRALALDPSDRSAFELIMQIIGAPTSELPPEADAELKAVEMRDRQRATRNAARAYLSWVFAVPEVLWMGVKSWTAFTLGGVMLSLAALAAFTQGRTGLVAPRHMRLALVLNFAAVGVTSSLFGPLVFTPALAAAMAASYVVSIRANKRTRILVGVLSCLAVFVPYLLQLAGILPASYAFEDGVIKILPLMVQFPARETQFFLMAVTAVQLIVPSILIGRAVESLITAERQNFAQAFRLRQLLPSVEQPETRAQL